MVDAVKQNLNTSLYNIAKDIYNKKTEDDVSIYDSGNSSAGKDCISIYLKGEEEIFKLINQRLSTIMNFSTDTSKIAEEIRAEYEQQHPEYVAAKREYETRYSELIKNHNRYIEEKITKWDEENPLNSYGTLGVATAHNRKREDYLKQLEKEYRSQNTSYDTYKKQAELINKNKKSSFTKGLLC